jgi:hypothetical protein
LQTAPEKSGAVVLGKAIIFLLSGQKRHRYLQLREEAEELHFSPLI